VPKRAFKPEPSVASAVLAIENIGKNKFKSVSEDVFFEIVKTGFAKKRKMLKSNLKNIADSETLERIFKDLEIPEKSRAEDINTEAWFELARAIEKNIA